MNAYSALPDATLGYVIKQLELRLAGLDPAESRHAAVLHNDYLLKLTAARDELTRRAGGPAPVVGKTARRRTEVHAMKTQKPDPRQRAVAEADAKMAAAKQRFSAAALACLRGALDAPAQVQRALQQVEAAREGLRALADAEIAGPAAHKLLAPRPAVRPRSANGRRR